MILGFSRERVEIRMTMTRLLEKYSTLAVIGVAAGALAALVQHSRRPASHNGAVPEPAKPVDPDRYLGLWYEFGRFENRFERGCEDVTARYGKRADGLIEIVNTCQKCSSSDRPRSARGRARIVEGSGNAKLKVSFFGPFFLGNYWVLDHDDDYSWSIVGEPSGRYLWILTRKAAPPESVQQALIDRCRSLGYDMTRFRRTLHASQGEALSGEVDSGSNEENRSKQKRRVKKTNAPASAPGR